MGMVVDTRTIGIETLDRFGLLGGVALVALVAVVRVPNLLLLALRTKSRVAL